MTLKDCLAIAHANPWVVIAMLAWPPLLALLLPGEPLNRSRATVWAVVLYAGCVPGMCALTGLLYTFTFVGKNLGNLDVLVAIAPILSMMGVLLTAPGKVNVARLPGIDRLWGFLGLLIATLGALYVLDRTRIIVFFHASVGWLLVVGVALFVLFRWSLNRLLGHADEKASAYES